MQDAKRAGTRQSAEQGQVGGKKGQYLWTDLGFRQDAPAYRVGYREFSKSMIVRFEQFP